MSLKLTNKATARQQEILAELEYIGTGRYTADQLTIEEAGKLIDELFTEKKYTTGQVRAIAADYYDMPLTDIYNIKQEDFDDPFAEVNK